MGVVGVEMVEAPGRVEEPATAAAAPVLLVLLAPVLLAALAPAGPVMELAGLVMGPVETVMEPGIAAAPPMPPLLRLMPLPLMRLPLTQRLRLLLTLPPPMPLPPPPPMLLPLPTLQLLMPLPLMPLPLMPLPLMPLPLMPLPLMSMRLTIPLSIRLMLLRRPPIPQLRLLPLSWPRSCLYRPPTLAVEKVLCRQ